MGNLVGGAITGLLLLFYGIYFIFFKELVSNKDIVFYLFVGFAYIAYSFQIYFDKIIDKKKE